MNATIGGIELEDECPRCHGNLTHYDMSLDEIEKPCRKCKGLGVVTSMDGEKLLQFFKRHLAESLIEGSR